MKIFLIVLIVLLFILIFPIKIKIKYHDDFYLKIYYMFIGFTVYPQKNKEDKVENKKTTSNTNKPKSNDQESFIDIKKIKEQDGINGVIILFKDIKDIISRISKNLVKTIYFSKIKVFISISDETPAETAIKYGRYCGILYPFIYKIIGELNSAKPVVIIRPNYEKNDDDVLAEINIFTLPITIIVILVSFMVRLIKFKLKYNNE